MYLDDVRLAHVADSEEKTELVVSFTYDGVLAEQKRLCSLLWSRQFGEHESCHQRLSYKNYN